MCITSGQRWLSYQGDFILSWSWIDEEGSEPLEDEKGIIREEYQFPKILHKGKSPATPVPSFDRHMREKQILFC